MRVLLLAFIIQGSLAIPKFTFLTSRSENEIPEIEVMFDNGVSDKLMLREYQLHSKSDVTTPNYIGHLANHLSSAAVTRDLNGLWHITLLSDQTPAAKFFQIDNNDNIKVVSMASAIAGSKGK